MDDSPSGDWDAFAPQEHGPGTRSLGVPEYLAVSIGVLIFIGLIVLWPSGAAKDQASTEFAVLGVPSEFHEALVTDVSRGACAAHPALHASLSCSIWWRDRT